MKKMFSLLLALVMIMSLSVSVSAAEGDQAGVEAGDYSANVTGAYVAGTTSSGTVFSVDIAWSNLSFTYHAEKAPVWDAEDHTYSEAVAAYWEGEGTITVTNHSNTKITAVPKYNPGDAYANADMVFSTDKLLVASAEAGSAQTGTITVTPAGYLPEMNESATIGSITVTIAQDTSVSVDDAKELIAQAKALETSAKESGAYNTYMTEFDSMNLAYSNLSDDVDLYEAVEAGSYAWDENGMITYEEWQDNFNSHYADLLSDYNDCKNLAGL